MSASSLAAPTANEFLIAQIDEQISTLSSRNSPSICDALLEVRAALSERSATPQGWALLVGAFLRNRRLLARFDYLWTHRFRRLLESSFRLRLEVNGVGRSLPLDLTWPDWEKLCNQARREHFEHFNHDWKEIELTLEPHIDYGQNAL